MLNKFTGPTDRNYQTVVYRIKELLSKCLVRPFTTLLLNAQVPSLN